jgi:tetraacyldisaccharide 4'-kinase
MLKLLLLYPASLIYGMVVYVRNNFYDYKIFKSTEFEIPVISIGNITVGGTGKTPHTEYLVELLKKHVKVATLSRGYKRKTKGFRLVETTSHASEVGDEPLQIKQKFPEITVAVDENRVRGINELMKDTDHSPDAVLLDDGFQHRKVTPGINILLIDYNHPIDKDQLLPLGRLRERTYQRRRANIIIYTKCPDEITPITRRITMKDVNLRPYQSLFFTTMVYGEPVPVYPESIAKAGANDEAVPLNHPVILLAGIANPQPLQKYVASEYAVIDEIIYGDHHYFTPKDLKKIEDTFIKYQGSKPIIITTEKDAMRLRDETSLPVLVQSRCYYIPLKIKFLDHEGKSFDKTIVGYVKDNRSNRELHKRTIKRRS